MNKALHVLVYVFLVVAGVALFFEIQLNAKRAELTDRNTTLRDYIFKVANTIEKADPAKDVATINKDADAVEAELVDSPNMENLLADYPAELEKQNLATYDWKNSNAGLIGTLRNIYQLDAEGKPIPNGANGYLIAGSDADKMLAGLFESAKKQQARLNNTRAALVDLHGKLEGVVTELNKLKGEARQDKVTIVERNEKIASLESEKAELENQITRKNSQIDELNSEVTSLKDEVATKAEEVEAKSEELAKANKLIEQLKKMMKEMVPTSGAKSSGLASVESLPAGDKGKIIEVDNENMFAIIAFSDEAMKDLKGDDLSHPLPAIELGVRRPGYAGEAGEFVGRIKLRQEVKGKNYVICDILSAWEQAKLEINDIIFAD